MKTQDVYRLTNRDASKQMFQPCEISEVLEEVRPTVYALRFGACYQVCDRQLNTMMGAGSPAIVGGKYANNRNLFSGDIRQAWRAKRIGVLVRKKDGQEIPLSDPREVLFYTLIFPNGLLVENEILHQSLRTILVENSRRGDAAYQSLKRIVDRDPNNQQWDSADKTISRVLYVDQPVLIAIQKDEIINGKIVRGEPRPWQEEPGVYSLF